MNEQPVKRSGACLAYAVGILGSLLIVAALTWALHKYTQPTPLGEDRATFRAQKLAEMRQEEAQALDSIGWLDPQKGIVRLPIEDAMALVEREWQNPTAARSNLIERVEKATAPAPKAPEKPSQFE